MGYRVNQQALRRLVEERSGAWSPGLVESERAQLLAIAQETLAWSAEGRQQCFDWSPFALTPALKARMATFVTYTANGCLRGCMGTLEAQEAMALSVHSSAANAARDPRFVHHPIAREDLGVIKTEVSLLSPREPIHTPKEFRVGEHGLWLSKHGLGAVYLPGVALEQGWTREQTLSSLCEKAGLDQSAWQDEVELAIFYSVVIKEA